MARRATLIDSLRREDPNLIVVDAGDFAEIEEPLAVDKSRFMLGLMTNAGYDAVTFGAREVELGLDSLALADTHPPIVLSNVLLRHPEGAAVAFAPEVIRSVDGLTVGIFGLLDPDASRASPAGDGRVEIGDPEASARRVLDTFADRGVDLVVLLSQMPRARTDSLLVHVPGIDLVVMGHGDSKPWMPSDDAILIAPGTHGRSVTTVDLVVSPEGVVIASDPEVILLNPVIPLEPEVQREVDEMERRVQDERLRRLGIAPG